MFPISRNPHMSRIQLNFYGFRSGSGPSCGPKAVSALGSQGYRTFSPNR